MEEDLGAYNIKMVQLRQACTVHSCQSLSHHTNYIHMHKYICIYKCKQPLYCRKKNINRCCTSYYVNYYYYCHSYYHYYYHYDYCYHCNHYHNHSHRYCGIILMLHTFLINVTLLLTEVAPHL